MSGRFYTALPHCGHHGRSWFGGTGKDELRNAGLHVISYVMCIYCTLLWEMRKPLGGRKFDL